MFHVSICATENCLYENSHLEKVILLEHFPWFDTEDINPIQIKKTSLLNLRITLSSKCGLTLHLRKTPSWVNTGLILDVKITSTFLEAKLQTNMIPTVVLKLFIRRGKLWNIKHQFILKTDSVSWTQTWETSKGGFSKIPPEYKTLHPPITQTTGSTNNPIIVQLEGNCSVLSNNESESDSSSTSGRCMNKVATVGCLPTIATYNVRSLFPKVGNIRTDMLEHGITLEFFSEIWEGSENKKYKFEIENLLECHGLI